MTERFGYLRPVAGPLTVDIVSKGVDERAVADLLQAYAHRREGCGGVEIDYTNWRKRRSLRRIIPVPGSLRRVEPGEQVAAWHEVGSWVFRAFDFASGEERHFAVSGVHSWIVLETTEPPPPTTSASPGTLTSGGPPTTESTPTSG